jgi:hypothetical protein
MNINTGIVSEDSRRTNNKKIEIFQRTHAETFSNRVSPPNIEGMIFSGLVLVALIPRVILARQLDLVTDEIIYINAGKIYAPLLIHLRFTASLWAFNYEHPPLVKLLIGFALYLNTHLGSPASNLFAARVPSILSGTALIVAIYWLGRAPFGRPVALLAALCLALSPWLVYFSALAYLDITMTALITVAYLVLWFAIRQPRLYLLSAMLLASGVASKYTALLALPGMIFWIAYYFIAIRPRLEIEQRPPLPWKWWLAALLLLPVTFFIADPAIWQHPYTLLLNSVLFEWQQSMTGHLTFLAGQYGLHVPHWAVLYIIFAKLSTFVTVPALLFLVVATIQLVRFHLIRAKLSITEVTAIAFLCIWLISIVSMFSLLNIVVGTHYLLPIAPPVALSGAYGIATLLRFRSEFANYWVNCRSRFIAPTADLSALGGFHDILTNFPNAPFSSGIRFQRNAAQIESEQARAIESTYTALSIKQRINGPSASAALATIALSAFFIAPHLLGLITIYAAEGYTSEIFNSENSIVQVAYPGYREAGLWLVAHTLRAVRVGIVALPNTVTHGDHSLSWFSFNHDIQGRLTYSETPPTSASFPFDYLFWPMHLIQRGYAIPPSWSKHVVHMIMGGNTIYCYILALNPTTII